jgi:4-hydroxy-tetrahydrodipicolinate reductase
MGAAMARIAAEKNGNVVFGADSFPKPLPFPVYKKLADAPNTANADVLIDFSHPSALPELLDYAKSRGLPVVVATTGYSEMEIAEIKKASEIVPVFFTFNMSLGINLLADLARKAAEVLGADFDIEIIEKHHNLKQDAPSGTALMLADAIEPALNYAPRFIYDRHNMRRARKKEEIGIHSVRGGNIVGEHEIIFAGTDEVITLSHSAGSKEVFAVGAFRAAQYIAAKKGGNGLYTMKDLI